MKKFLALLLSLAMLFAMAACGDSGSNTQEPTGNNQGSTDDGGEETGNKTIKVGMICIGDENDQGYTYNFIRGVDATTEHLAQRGIDVEWVFK